MSSNRLFQTWALTKLNSWLWTAWKVAPLSSWRQLNGKPADEEDFTSRIEIRQRIFMEALNVRTTTLKMMHFSTCNQCRLTSASVTRSEHCRLWIGRTAAVLSALSWCLLDCIQLNVFCTCYDAITARSPIVCGEQGHRPVCRQRKGVD